ncbi:hypothetical protein [Streptomyces sp. MNP-20]|uniref:hypothetical protein n=1 Tax=Streptomyces sp. MNP-20 TaxID=2721165 RepID=UPI001552CEB0|nr:hypothetical protein [Streptomyces sp. MNP-20]
MTTRLTAVSLGAAVIAAVGFATVASASPGSDGSDAPKPKPKPRIVKAQAAQAGSPVTGNRVTLNPGQNLTSYATCPQGTAPTGGGGTTSSYDIFFTDSYASGSAWILRGTNKGSAPQDLTAFALCQ